MKGIEAHWAALRERVTDRTVAVSAAGAAGPVWVLVVGGVVVAYLLTYLVGGTKTSLPHLFYMPVIVAAARFGRRGALATAVLAGLAAGPLMPLDATAGTMQDAQNWLARLGFFALIGVLTAHLCRHSLPSLGAELHARRFRRELTHALASGHIAPAYQPIIDLRESSLAGVEALVRWHDPTVGARSPAQFIVEAERAGCIGELTRFMLEKACADVSRWRNGILAGRSDFTLAVNISAADVIDPELARIVESTLAATGLPNRWLHLEITETALVDDIDAAAESLMNLRMLGVRLAIDDFGTGESSLAHLDRFPVDVLKVDRVFLRRVRDDDAIDPLTQGIVAMGHAMNMAVLAEGIETCAQLHAVRECGYDLAQGFLLSPPLTPEQLECFAQPPILSAALRSDTEGAEVGLRTEAEAAPTPDNRT